MKTVVLVHGLGMKGFIMQFLHRHLSKEGFKVKSFNYNTYQFEKGVDKLHKEVEQGGKVYFVGHSLGGLIVRRYFEKYSPQFEDTCLVTLGTPHNGSCVAGIAQKITIKKIFGNSTETLVHGIDKMDSGLVVGCIVGTTNFGIGSFIRGFSGDGTVRREEAVLEGAKDIIEVNETHTTLIYSKKVVRKILCFIANRTFNN